MVDIVRARELITRGNELSGESVAIEVLGEIVGEAGDRSRDESEFISVMAQVSPPETLLEGGVPVTILAFTIVGGGSYIPKVNDIATIAGRNVPIQTVTENRLLGEVLTYRCEGNI